MKYILLLFLVALVSTIPIPSGNQKDQKSPPKQKQAKTEVLLDEYTQATNTLERIKMGKHFTNEDEKTKETVTKSLEKTAAERRVSLLNHGRISNSKGWWLLAGTGIASAMAGDVIGSGISNAFT